VPLCWDLSICVIMMNERCMNFALVVPPIYGTLCFVVPILPVFARLVQRVDY